MADQAPAGRATWAREMLRLLVEHILAYARFGVAPAALAGLRGSLPRVPVGKGTRP